MLCEICKSDLPEGALFCGECGSAVRHAEAPVVASPVVAAPTVDVPAEAPAEAPAAETPVVEESGLKGPDETSRDTQIVPRIEDPALEALFGAVAPALVEPARFADEVPAGIPATDVPASDTFTSVSELESLVSFTITLGTGESVILTQSALVGRMPQPAEGEQFEHLIVIADPGRSVSKTHLELGITNGQLWIADRNSGNGSIVREPGVVPRRAQPGTRYEIVRGTRIDLGDQHLTIS